MEERISLVEFKKVVMDELSFLKDLITKMNKNLEFHDPNTYMDLCIQIAQFESAIKKE